MIPNGHYVEQPWAKTQRSPFAAERPGRALRPPFFDVLLVTANPGELPAQPMPSPHERAFEALSETCIAPRALSSPSLPVQVKRSSLAR